MGEEFYMSETQGMTCVGPSHMVRDGDLSCPCPLLFLSFAPSLVQRGPHDTMTFGADREESAWAVVLRASWSNHSLLMPPANTPAFVYQACGNGAPDLGS